MAKKITDFIMFTKSPNERIEAPTTNPDLIHRKMTWIPTYKTNG
jgi:hypothetical protein